MSLPAAAATCIVAASFLGKVTVQMGPPVPALNKTNQTELEQACGGCTEPSYENSQYYPLLAVTRAAHETSQGDIRYPLRCAYPGPKLPSPTRYCCYATATDMSPNRSDPDMV
jgi:hypothetical protein